MILIYWFMKKNSFFFSWKKYLKFLSYIIVIIKAKNRISPQIMCSCCLARTRHSMAAWKWSSRNTLPHHLRWCILLKCHFKDKGLWDKRHQYCHLHLKPSQIKLKKKKISGQYNLNIYNLQNMSYRKWILRLRASRVKFRNVDFI